MTVTTTAYDDYENNCKSQLHQAEKIDNNNNTNNDSKNNSEKANNENGTNANLN